MKTKFISAFKYYELTFTKRIITIYNGETFEFFLSPKIVVVNTQPNTIRDDYFIKIYASLFQAINIINKVYLKTIYITYILIA